MSECLYNVGVAQILSQGNFHWGPIRSALYILVLLWCYDLHSHTAYLSLLLACIAEMSIPFYEMQHSQLGCSYDFVARV